jgi:exonuclease III
LIQISNYKVEGSCRLNRRGGGVVLYIKQDLVYKIRKDLCIGNSEMETFFIELVHSNKSNVIIGIVYKPPSVSCNVFTDDMDVMLGRLNAENKKCYIMGDYNVNLLQSDTDNAVQHFMSILDSQSCYPTINKPTRITTDSATLIDNILTNDYSNHTGGVLITDISDHLPVFFSY